MFHSLSTVPQGRTSPPGLKEVVHDKVGTDESDLEFGKMVQAEFTGLE